MDKTFWRLLMLAQPIAGWLLLAMLLGVTTIASGIGLMTTSAYLISEAGDWETPAEVKEKYGNASVLKDGRVVFNICGNNYRLVTRINYTFRTIYIRFIGTHAEYDKIDAATI